MQKDYFTLGFRFVSAILLLVLVLLTITIILFRPHTLPATKAEQSQTLYYGSPYRGFFTRKTIIDPITAIKTEFFPADITETQKNNLPRVLYVPDIFSSTHDATEELLLLAQKGFRVTAFDFYSKDIDYLNSLLDSKLFRDFSNHLLYYFYPSFYTNNKEALLQNKEIELFAGLSILQSEEPSPVFVIAEGFTVWGAEKLQHKYAKVIQGVFISNEAFAIEPSKNMRFAHIEKTKPLEALFLNIKQHELEPYQKASHKAALYFLKIQGETDDTQSDK